VRVLAPTANLVIHENLHPALQTLLKRFESYYLPKIPGIRGHLDRMLEAYGVTSPWSNPGILTASGAPAVWTPEAPAEPAPSKLWLPGE